ncbi:hypothetical protein V7094_27880 [Priestia megaterium]|uniref:hypothetical protein n=1 Tax=Priestia megaterium TaxID=1404 RepID=UPI0030008110
MFKIVHVNQQTYDAIVSKLGYKPFNMQINPHIEDNKAIIINQDIVDMYKHMPIAKLVEEDRHEYKRQVYSFL